MLTPFSWNNEHYNYHSYVGAGHWIYRKLKEVDNNAQYGRVLVTNGHKWCLFEIHSDHVKKTDFFVPKMPEKGKEGAFVDDWYHVQAILGLIRFSLGGILNRYRRQQSSLWKKLQN